ncbi:MAG: ribosome-associated translation inhibitor RaiA [Saprospiraceae bacterium]|nr:ribosome-associated translation inhibitor RaiA [Saprospiraceae bacterium]
MKIIIHAPWEVNTLMQELIEQKMEKLLKYESHIQKADVYLKNGEGESIADKNVEIRLKTNYNEIFAQDTAAELEVALAEAVAKAKRQLIKRKQKLQAHH